MRIYPFTRVGKLLTTKACLEDKGGQKLLTLLVDTGSTYTIIPVEALEGVGVSPAESKDHVRIVAASGILIVPRVVVASFQCLGHREKKFTVIGHTLPPAGPIDGLLGMDFLSLVKGQIDISEGSLRTEIEDGAPHLFRK